MRPGDVERAVSEEQSISHDCCNKAAACCSIRLLDFGLFRGGGDFTINRYSHGVALCGLIAAVLSI